ncbi:phage holin family protein [Phaeovibrio sulfidiphilus]|uniref:Phage holin family protein n=1 Tax=Phaeovibrio sulfidiphilus TaxID=1220600 RepID=A0A8J6YKV7_9PROT|nr:phage holin family protein [Phaeovibrio sulfidiphilus]MBE1236328.1 phage holin family protein [Phaeovibrio sulfidiphilus]
MSDALFLYANGAICALICLRLLFFRQGRTTYHPAISLLAYGLAVASGSVALRTAFGAGPPQVDWSELVLNGTVCISLFSVRGNLGRLLRWGPPVRFRAFPRMRCNAGRAPVRSRAAGGE